MVRGYMVRISVRLCTSTGDAQGGTNWGRPTAAMAGRGTPLNIAQAKSGFRRLGGSKVRTPSGIHSLSLFPSSHLGRPADGVRRRPTVFWVFWWWVFLDAVVLPGPRGPERTFQDRKHLDEHPFPPVSGLHEFSGRSRVPAFQIRGRIVGWHLVFGRSAWCRVTNVAFSLPYPPETRFYLPTPLVLCATTLSHCYLSTPQAHTSFRTSRHSHCI